MSCGRHCYVWASQGTTLLIRCAHCPYVREKLDLSDTHSAEELKRKSIQTRFSHRRLCRR